MEVKLLFFAFLVCASSFVLAETLGDPEDPGVYHADKQYDDVHGRVRHKPPKETLFCKIQSYTTPEEMLTCIDVIQFDEEDPKGGIANLSLANDDRLKEITSKLAESKVPIVLNNSIATSLSFPKLYNTKDFTISGNLNLETMETDKVKKIIGKELVIENNPKLKEIKFPDIEMVNLQNGIYIKNNPSITSVNIGSLDDLKLNDLIIENNRNLKDIFLSYKDAQNKIKNIAKVRISGNPNLEQYVINGFTFKFTDVQDKYIQGFQECVFPEPLEFLEDLKICKYVLGDLVISQSAENFNSDNVTNPLAEVRNGTIIIKGTKLHDLSIFNGTTVDRLEMEDNIMLCNITEDDVRAIFNVTDLFFVDTPCPTTTTITTPTTTRITTTAMSTMPKMVPSEDPIDEDTEDQPLDDEALAKETPEQLAEKERRMEKRRKGGVLVMIGLTLIAGGLCFAAAFAFTVRLYLIHFETLKIALYQKRKKEKELAKRKKDAIEFYRIHPFEIPKEIIFPVTQLTCEPVFEFEGEYPHWEEAQEITNEMFQRDVEEMRARHIEIMDKIRREPVIFDRTGSETVDPETPRHFTRYTFLGNQRVGVDLDKFEIDDGYYNGSYMGWDEETKERFIVGEAPRRNTDYNFWALVLQHNCSGVVQIGNFFDPLTETEHNIEYYPLRRGGKGTFTRTPGSKEILIENLGVQWMPPDFEGYRTDIDFYKFRGPGHKCRKPRKHRKKGRETKVKGKVFEEWPMCKTDPMDPFDEETLRQMVKIRKLRVRCPDLNIDRIVYHFQFMNWPPGGRCPSFPHLFNLIHLLNKLPGTIFAHSLYGCERAPFLAVTTMYLDRLRRGKKMEDPFELVEMFANQRFGCFYNFYQILYLVLVVYVYTGKAYPDVFQNIYEFDEETRANVDGWGKYMKAKGDLAYESHIDPDKRYR